MPIAFETGYPIPSVDIAEKVVGHQHPFEQCGIVIAGKIEMFMGDERSVLEAMDTYFIPAGVIHGWKTFEVPTRLLDVSAKP